LPKALTKHFAHSRGPILSTGPGASSSTATTLVAVGLSTLWFVLSLFYFPRELLKSLLLILVIIWSQLENEIKPIRDVLQKRDLKINLAIIVVRKRGLVRLFARYIPTFCT
jgi:hypothetical protein